MEFLSRHRPWPTPLAARAEHPDAVPIMGGTDVMVELNFDRRRPAVPARPDPGRRAGHLGARRRRDPARCRASPTRRVIDELGGLLPGLALASRTVGSPQIRNRGTVGGNLGAASPGRRRAPALLAALAEVELASVAGYAGCPVDEFYTGVKRHVAAARRADHRRAGSAGRPVPSSSARSAPATRW